LVAKPMAHAGLHILHFPHADFWNDHYAIKRLGGAPGSANERPFCDPVHHADDVRSPGKSGHPVIASPCRLLTRFGSRATKVFSFSTAPNAFHTASLDG
jgi:hypothetical protein